jgi:L-fuconolactonase
VTVVDAHHHLWDPARADYPWMTDELAMIRRRFDVGDLEAVLAASGVDATVLVQTRASVEESVEFLAVAAPGRSIAGVIGWVDLTREDVGEAIARLRAGPGGERLVGIRHQVHDEPDPDWLGRPDVRRGLAAVADAGLAYDLLVRTRELRATLDAVRAMPGLRFVIDHAAKPPIATGALGAWQAAIEPFGALDNVACKLSGLVTEADWRRWTVDDLRPVAEVVLETFGPRRTMFGSDWPVCLVAADYPAVLGSVRALVSSVSAGERDAVFGETAIGWYGLRVDAGSRSPNR